MHFARVVGLLLNSKEGLLDCPIYDLYTIATICWKWLVLCDVFYIAVAANSTDQDIVVYIGFRQCLMDMKASMRM